MHRVLSCMTIAVLMLFAGACVSTKPVVLNIDKLPEQKARTALLRNINGSLRAKNPDATQPGYKWKEL